MSNEATWKRDVFDSIGGGLMSLDELEEIVVHARKAEAAGIWKNFSTEMDSGYYGDSPSLMLYGERKETAIERELRERTELEAVTKRAEWERKQYEELKKKFEK